MKRRPQIPLIHMVSIALLRKLGLQCRFQSTRRPTAPLGSRILTDPSRVFEHNMWDHIQWSPEQEDLARQKVEENSSVKIPVEEQVKYDKDAGLYWDEFYRAHQNKFFKDRRWLFLEFPELLQHRTHECNEVDLESKNLSISCSCVSLETQTKLAGIGRAHAKQTFETGEKVNSMERTNGGMNFKHKLKDWKRTDIQKNQGCFPGSDCTFKIFEVGCGAGNSVFPILSEIRELRAFLYCCDISARAVDLVMSHPLYNASQCYAFVHDLCDEANSTYPFPEGCIDVILLVFVLSSIHPERSLFVWQLLCARRWYLCLLLYQRRNCTYIHHSRFERSSKCNGLSTPSQPQKENCNASCLDSMQIPKALHKRFKLRLSYFYISLK
ncbi:tRNA N(3)-methylcytidine methyltransferase METTL8, mitochondrial isoform X5 [Narcine bancroftii]|uniref:tRNA N(3)-methylcytidine methyltransferase METTL8, mitochondrial isoform X5 n=1 Tax=Narcine bancroftii TaxID=1343680 RepID=UPI003831B7BF